MQLVAFQRLPAEARSDFRLSKESATVTFRLSYERKWKVGGSS